MADFYVAREFNNNLYLWRNKPHKHIATEEEKEKLYPSDYNGTRIEGWWESGFDVAEDGAVELSTEMFPNLKWEDEPIEVELWSKDYWKRTIDDIIHKYIAKSESGEYGCTNDIINSITEEICG